MLRYHYDKHIIYWACCAGLFLFGMALALPAAVSLDLRLHYGLDAVAAAALLSRMPLGLLAGSLMFGPLSGGVGYRFVMVAAALGMFAGFRGVAFAGEVRALEGWMFCLGVSGGMMNGAANALVADMAVRGKGASLSLLGVAFGAGLLAMPQLMVMLTREWPWRQLLEGIGCFALGLGIICVMTRFPVRRAPVELRRLLRDGALWWIGIFLFFQCGFESVLYHWGAQYLSAGLGWGERESVFGLTLCVAGMTVVRLLLGSVFRNISPRQLLAVSLLLLPAGILLLKLAGGFMPAAMGMLMLGGGLAGGFPIMLGFVGERYPGQSGGAIGMVMGIAVAGRLWVDALMPWGMQEWGMQYLTTMALLGWVAMLALAAMIVKRLP